MTGQPGPDPLETLKAASRQAAQEGPQDPMRTLPEKSRQRLFSSLRAASANHGKQIAEGPSAFDDLTYAKAAFVDVAGRGFVDTLLQGGVGLVNLAGDAASLVPGVEVPDLQLDFMDIVSGFDSEAAREASAAVDDVLWRGEYDNTPLRLTRQGAKIAGVTTGFVIPGALPHAIVTRGGQAGQWLGRTLSQPVQKFLRNSDLVAKAGLTAGQAERLMRTGQLWTHLAKNSSGMGGAGKRLLGVLERNGVTPAAVLGSASGFALLNYLTTNQARDPETGDVIPFTQEDKFSAAQAGAIAGSFMPILGSVANQIEARLATPGLSPLERAQATAAKKWLQDGGANLWNKTVAKGLAAGAEAVGFMGVHRETWEAARAVWNGDLDQAGELLSTWAGTAFVLWAMRQGRGIDAYRQGRYEDPDANRLGLRLDADYIRTGGDKPPPEVDPVLDRYSAVMFRAGAEVGKMTETGLELTMPGVKDPIIIRNSTEGGTKHPIEVDLPPEFSSTFGGGPSVSETFSRQFRGDVAAGVLENIAMRTMAARASGSAIYGAQGLREVEVGSGVYLSRDGLWLHSVSPEGKLVRRDATDPSAEWEVTGDAQIPSVDRLPRSLEGIAEGWREVVDNLRDAGLGQYSLEALSTTLATAFGNHGGHRNIREIQALLSEIGSPQEFAALLTPANARAAIFELASVASGSMNARLAFERLLGENGILRTGTSSEAPGPGTDLHGYLTPGTGTAGESTVAGVTRVDRSTTEGRRESREAAAAAVEAGEMTSPTDIAKTFGVSRETARALISRANQPRIDPEGVGDLGPPRGRQRPSGEEGLIATDLLTLPIEGAAEVGKFALEAGRAAKRFTVDSLLDRVEAQAGVQGKDLAQRGRRSTDAARQQIGRLFEENLPAIRRASRNTPEVREASKDARVIDVPGGRAGETVWVAAVEGRAPNVSPKLDKLVQTYRKLFRDFGEQAVATGVVQQLPDGSSRLFKPSSEVRLLRPKTQDAMDIESTPGPAQDVLLEALAAGNGISVPQAREQLSGRGERLERQEGFEGTRDFEFYPSWIEVGGERIELLRHAHPFEAITGIIEGSATRLAQIREFGQDLPVSVRAEFDVPEPGPTFLIDAFEAAGGVRQHGVELLRTLSGRAATDPILQPGSRLAAAGRRLRQMENARATGLLSRAFLPNIPEVLGGAVAFGGARQALSALLQVARNPKAALDELAALGVVHRPIFNLTWRSGNRMDAIVAGLNLGFPSSFLLRGVQKMSDAVSGVMARNMFMDAMQGRRQTSFEAVARMLDFTPAEIASVLRGDAQAMELAPGFMRRFNVLMSSSGATAAEMPAMTNRRAFRYWFRFFSFFVKKQAQGLTLAGDIAAAKGAGQKTDAVARMAKWLAGNAAAGFFARFLVEAWKAGPDDAAEQMWAEMTSNPWSFAGEASLYSILGGPLASATGIAGALFSGDDSEVVEAASRISPTAGLMVDVIRAAGGYGQYRDEDGGDRASKFFQSNILPVARDFDAIQPLMGMEEDPDFNDAHRAFWKNRIDVEPLSGVSGVSTDEVRTVTKDLRDNIRELVNVPPEKALDRKSIEESMREALEVQSGDQLARRLRRSKYLDERTGYIARLDPGKQVQVLDRLSTRNIAKLRAHDELVEAVARSVEGVPGPAIELDDLEGRMREAAQAANRGVGRPWRKITEDVIDQAADVFAAEGDVRKLPSTYKVLAVEMANWPESLEGALSDKEIRRVQAAPSSRKVQVIEAQLLNRIRSRGASRRDRRQ